ncbi:MAG: hypothetical protein ACJ8DY_02915, partial [Xanthobacteraceae bacterium]
LDATTVAARRENVMPAVDTSRPLRKHYSFVSENPIHQQLVPSSAIRVDSPDAAALAQFVLWSSRVRGWTASLWSDTGSGRAPESKDHWQEYLSSAVLNLKFLFRSLPHITRRLPHVMNELRSEFSRTLTGWPAFMRVESQRDQTGRIAGASNRRNLSW